MQIRLTQSLYLDLKQPIRRMLSYELVCLVTKLPREQNKCEKKKQNLLILHNVGHIKVLIILPSTFRWAANSYRSRQK